MGRQRALPHFGDVVLDHDDSRRPNAVLTETCRPVAEALGTDPAKGVQINTARNAGFVWAGIGCDEGTVRHQRISLTEPSLEAHAISSAEPVITTGIARETRFHFADFLVIKA